MDRTRVSDAEITVHYHRPEGDYGGWALWIWDGETGEGGRAIQRSGRDRFGLLYRIRPAEIGRGTRVGMLPVRGEGEAWDRPDRLWMPDLGVEVFLVSEDPALRMVRPDVTPRIVCALADGPRTIRVLLSRGIRRRRLRRRRFRLEGPSGRIPIASVEPAGETDGRVRRLRIEPARDLDPEAEDLAAIRVCVRGYRPAPLLARDILLRYEVGEELGPVEVDGGVDLRVFAPTAKGVEVRLYEAAEGGDPEIRPLARSPGGVWRVRLEGEGRRYYTLAASGSDPRFAAECELLDPWARAVTGSTGRAILAPRGAPAADPPAIEPADLVIYELHVRDFTVDGDSGIEAKGRYAGLAERGTRVPGTDIATGLDHLLELGVNAVQIMPVHEFDKEEGSPYSWGYMPVLFGAPESGYGSDPREGRQIEELRALIDALHREGITVILDLVLNHTAEAPPRKVLGPAGLVPGYYYRTRDDGTLWNGSGTGNEFRSEAPVARKLIVDALCRWVREFGVDGFRLDLMGLVDLETIEAALDALRAIRPDIILYGEPWAAGETPIRPTRKGDQRGKGFAVFNDGFRDALRGRVFTLDRGFAQGGGGIEGVRLGVRGGVEDFADGPLEAIQYAACHDNRTFWDRIVATTAGDPAVDDEARRAMVRIAATILLTSQGIPFLHAGQEMLRTKGGSDNSYDLGDEVNRIRWRWKIDHAEIFAYTKGLIEIRRAHALFRKRTREEVLRDVRFLDGGPEGEAPAGTLGYRILRGDSPDAWEAALVLANPTGEVATFALPPGPWTLHADGRRAGDRPLGGTVLSETLPVAPRSAVILAR